jgi:NADPH:quinone reductase-like Zn-dependent oxidoreductase
MRCAVLREGHLEVLEREAPLPGPLDVMVEVRAAGINSADLLQRRGLYPAPPGSPADIPGMEMAGLVAGVGTQVHEALLGRRVCGIVGGGAQASHCVIASEHLIFLPERATWVEAGGFAEAFLTAHDALVAQGQLREGERVLISGATGGVGTAAVQIAHHLGAHVIAVTRTGEHHEALRAFGADETITLEDVAAIEPVDVVLELVGAAHLSVALHRLAPFARVVVIGVGNGGASLEVDLRRIMATRATLTGSTLRSRSRDEKTVVVAAATAFLAPLWASGDLSVPLSRSFALDDVGAAYDYFALPGKFGKVVLVVE